MTLHVYQNWVVETFIAESLEEVKEIARKYFIENYGSHDDIDDDYLDFKELPDDKTMTVLNDPYEDPKDEEKMTCKEFAEKYGKGFLCSTEY